jgi:Tfp pilus assembly protein PilE
MKRSGFTFVEVAVVLIIVAMSVILLIPAIQQARKAAVAAQNQTDKLVEEELATKSNRFTVVETSKHPVGPSNILYIILLRDNETEREFVIIKGTDSGMVFAPLSQNAESR